MQDSSKQELRRRRGASEARRRGLLRLALLIAAIAAVAVVIASIGGGSGANPSAGSQRSDTAAGQPGQAPARPQKLVARLAPRRLPAAVSGEAAVARSGAVLSIGGLDSALVSTTGVYEIAPGGRSVVRAGSLAAPLHDAATASLGGRTLVFGGGAATTIDSVEALTSGGAARPIGHLPTTRSDLSAVTVNGDAYVLGGYDGTAPVASVLETSDGRRFTEIARLPTAVRYAAVAALGPTIYVFGGELADGTDSDAIQSIDVRSHRARLIGRLPTPISHASAVALGGRIFILGGRIGGVATDRILSFDAGAARVKPAGHLPAAVTNAAAASAGGTGYLIGGLGASGTALSSIITTRLVPRGRPAQ